MNLTTFNKTKVHLHRWPQHNPTASHSLLTFQQRFSPREVFFIAQSSSIFIANMQIAAAIHPSTSHTRTTTTEFIVPWHHRIASHLKCEIDSIAIRLHKRCLLYSNIHQKKSFSCATQCLVLFVRQSYLMTTLYIDSFILRNENGARLPIFCARFNPTWADWI